MDYAAFVSWAKAQDKRNRFVEYTDSLDVVLDELRDFYRAYNPIDVEISDDGLGVVFYPVGKLAELQKDYAYLNAQFIFATCNSDPIFIHDTQVFTCPHGVRQPQWEKLADSFCEYIKKLASSQH